MPSLSAAFANPTAPSFLATEPIAAERCPCGKRRPLAVALGLRSATRPCFEGRWFCRRSCLEEAVARAVRRELRNGVSGETRVRHRVPLGLILQARGVLTYAELQGALQLQQGSGARLGKVLTEHFGITEDRIATALATQWNCPVWAMPEMPTTDLLRLAPWKLFQRSGSLPLRLIGKRLCMASADSVDAPVALALERMHGIQVESGIAAASLLDEFCSHLGKSASADTAESECKTSADVTSEAARILAQFQPVSSRMVRVGRRFWLRAWLETAAAEGGPMQVEDVVDHLFTLPATATRHQELSFL